MLVTHVELTRDGRGTEFGGGRACSGLAAAGDHHPRTRLGERGGHRRAQAAGGTGNQHPESVQAHHTHDNHARTRSVRTVNKQRVPAHRPGPIGGSNAISGQLPHVNAGGIDLTAP